MKQDYISGLFQHRENARITFIRYQARLLQETLSLPHAYRSELWVVEILPAAACMSSDRKRSETKRELFQFDQIQISARLRLPTEGPNI